MRKSLTMLALMVFAGAGSQAQIFKYSNEFLAIGAGARGLSMGGAVIASCNDVTSIYWNPAGLATGVDHVLVNGVVAWALGAPTGARPGMVIRA